MLACRVYEQIPNVVLDKNGCPVMEQVPSHEVEILLGAGLLDR
jgi:hypothetical protein